MRRSRGGNRKVLVIIAPGIEIRSVIRDIFYRVNINAACRAFLNKSYVLQLIGIISEFVKYIGLICKDGICICYADAHFKVVVVIQV